MPLEISKENEGTLQECYALKFIENEHSSKIIRLLPGTYKMLEDYFKPKEINSKDNPQFEELWKLHAKGNKKTAKDRFIKSIKKVSFDELKSKLEAYIKSNDFCYLKGLDVWLNPEKEHWSDPIVKKEDKFKKPEEPVKSSFFRQ